MQFVRHICRYHAHFLLLKYGQAGVDPYLGGRGKVTNTTRRQSC